MIAAKLVTELEGLGVHIWEDGGQLRYRAPSGSMTAQRLDLLREYKGAVLDYLRNRAGHGEIFPDPEGRYQPFPLTDIQAAYLLGRANAYAYGGIGCHAYGELIFPDLDPVRLEAAWEKLVERHDMLRAIIDPGGFQQVLETTPRYRIDVLDLRGVDAAAIDRRVDQVRRALDHKVYETNRWPLFDLAVTRATGHAILHFSIDFLIADYISIHLILDELRRLYENPSEALPALTITFRDYLKAALRFRGGAAYRSDREYWWSKIDDLPPAPVLPLRAPSKQEGSVPARFRRLSMLLTKEDWSKLRQRAREESVTPSAVLLAAYAEAVAFWSNSPRFTLNVTLLQRPPADPNIVRLVGDFTSVNLLAVEFEPAAALLDRIRTVQKKLWYDLDHALCSGIEVMREIARRRGASAALMPIVFTSALGLGNLPGSEGEAVEFGESGYAISQTPQVWIDCQVMERGSALSINWDIRESVFPDGVAEDMFAAFETLVRRLGTCAEVWRRTDTMTLPAAQRECRSQVNATNAPVPNRLLHADILRQAVSSPSSLAIIDERRAVSFAELASEASAIAAHLRARGSRPGEVVAVSMNRGAEQIVSVLGVLLAGGAYLPVDAQQPVLRRERIVAAAGARFVLTSARDAEEAIWPDHVQAIVIDRVCRQHGAGAAPAVTTTPDDIAYVIYTSGSTGIPKGVMITHRSALNTLDDINRRFAVGPADRVLGISNLGFDLSVYDIFGVLGAGGCLILPKPDGRSDPTHWAELIERNRITIWNSVPAQLQMLADYLALWPPVDLTSLRLALISGDWIPISLPGKIHTRLPEIEMVSLGGATEAAIWSIIHPIREVPPAAPSIPYGKPLANQSFHIFDEWLRACADWVKGEIYIGGIGLAQGYLGDQAMTEERFLRHPVTGERLYRTGDFGRYWPDGTIEFLGREDLQVKIRGNRIELGDIESTLQTMPGVGRAVVLAIGDPLQERKLVGFAEPAATPCGAGVGANDSDVKDVNKAAEAAGRSVLSDVDVADYCAYLRELDETALFEMLGAFLRCGLFTNPSAVHSLDQILDLTGTMPIYRRLVGRWLRALTCEGVLQRDADGKYCLTKSFDPNSLKGRWARAEMLRRDNYNAAALLEYFRGSAERLPELLRGEADAKQLLFPEATLDLSDALYRDALFNRWANAAISGVARHLAKRRRVGAPFRVLEIGAGSGGTTTSVVTSLAGENIAYLATDVSPFFVGEARQRFRAHSEMRHAIFDMDSDPWPQGFAPNSFDLVIASDAIHNAKNVLGVLRRIKTLVAPGGWLVFSEMTRDHYQIMISLEFMHSSEKIEDHDLRRDGDQVFLTAEQWLDLLGKAEAGSARTIATADPQWDQIGMRLFAAQFKADRAALSPVALTAWLQNNLPDHMVPHEIHVLDSMPLTGNGKIDRKALAAWHAERATGQANVGGEEPRTDLEIAIADIIAGVLKCPRVARDTDFFALGGDSLLAAQLTTKLIETIPVARQMFFDDLLRRVLEGPTVAELAAVLASDAPAPAVADKFESASPLAILASRDGAKANVFIHGPDGTLERLLPVLGIGTNGGSQYAFEIRDTRTYLATEASLLMERTAAAYTKLLVNGSGVQFELVGEGFGGLLAVEMARQLMDAGAAVPRVTVIDAVPLPIAHDDDLLAEYLFALELGLEPATLGYPPVQSVLETIVGNGSPDPGPGGDAILRLFGDAPQSSRDARLAELAAAHYATQAGADRVAQLNRRLDVFRHSLHAASLHRPSYCACDMRVVRSVAAPSAWSRDTDAAHRFWSQIVVGDIEFIELADRAPWQTWTADAARAAGLIG